MKSTAAALLVFASLGGLALAQAVKVEDSITGYAKTSGVSGNINSVGSDTMNNLMTLWAESFLKMYPNVKIQVEGKGSSTAPPALIAGTAQFGPMSRAMRATEIDQFEKKYGYKPTQIRTCYDALAVYVNKDNPLEKLDPRAGGRGLLEDAAAAAARTSRPGASSASPATGPAGPSASTAATRRQRHLRVLQGARAAERRLQGHGEGAAGLGVGRPGRHRGPLRHGLQRHRLQDLGRQGRAARGEGRRLLLGRAATRT